MDVSTVASVMAAGLSALPSARVPIGTRSALEVPPATAPVGRQGAPLQNTPYQPVRNAPTQINARSLSGHALDQMQNRGIPPSVVENAIRTGQHFQGNTPGTVGFYDSVNNVSVIQNVQSGNIITVRPGPP